MLTHEPVDYLVDADTHIDVDVRELAAFADEPWRTSLKGTPMRNLVPYALGDTSVRGRILRPPQAGPEAALPSLNAAIRVVFPGELLRMTLHPNGLFQVGVAAAYNRWLTDVYLPGHPEARGMLYLPLVEPEAALRILATFGDCRGVVGGFVTMAGLPRLHENRYLDLYRAMEERGLALGIHPLAVWSEQPLNMFDQFLPVWAFGQPFNQSVLLTNWVLHAMPDRLPDLRCIFYECGLCWLTFISHRLDAEFLKRPSEAPLLRERPSHYIQRCLFSTQPVDQLADPGYLALPIRQVGVSQLLYGSNLPRWDFDTPEAVTRLPFLSAADRQAILGGNARRVFRLEAGGGVRKP